MMDKFSKNSLLRQIKEKGIVTNSSENGEHLPFGILTGNFEDSPFNLKNSQDNPIKKDVKIIEKHLNTLDNTLFNYSNYLNIEDRELSKNEKIKKIKELIKKANEKIFILEDSDNEEILDKIKADKENLLNALEVLNENDRTEKIININGKNSAKQNLKLGLNKFETFIFRLCPPLYKSFLVRKALYKLRKLNDSANEICNKEFPYHGEADGRYNDFIACLSCANTINAKLTKKI